MATIFAQHATAGKYHLETRYIDGRWEWVAALVRKAAPTERKLPEYSGVEDSLDAAVKKAAMSIGLSFANWENVGPAVKVSD
jgi:hypothetical protein